MKRFVVAAVLLLAGSGFAATEAQSRVPEGPLVVSENWPECTDLQTWMRDIMRLEGLEKATETAQAKAFFRWLRLFSKMATGGMIQAHEGPYGREAYVLDAHKNAFVYGWGYCDTHSRIAEAAWSEFKHDRKAAERVVVQHADGGYHTMYRLRLDGRYAAFDARYGYYLIEKDTPDARILDWAEVGDDRRILENREYRNRSTPFFEYFGREWERALLVQPVYYETEDGWVKAGRPVECVFGNGQYEMGTRFHDMSFRLPRGTTLERYWDNSARKFYVPARFESKGEEPFRPSGRFYRVTETMFDGNWVKYDANYKLSAPYVSVVPSNEGYNPDVSGGRTIGQSWGKMIYQAPLSRPGFLDDAPVVTDLVSTSQSPYLRPATTTAGGQATFDFYSPYVLVDGVLSGDWEASAADLPQIEIRVLEPKPRSQSEPDVWSPWQAIGRAAGPFRIELGRPRFNARDVSIHGAYRFQVRFSFDANHQRQTAVGLKSLRLETWFENGIMSIPRLIAGKNTIHFKLKDAATLKSSVRVTFGFQNDQGAAEHEHVLTPRGFRGNVASYSFDAPGLRRCNWVKIRYE